MLLDAFVDAFMHCNQITNETKQKELKMNLLVGLNNIACEYDPQLTNKIINSSIIQQICNDINNIKSIDSFEILQEITFLFSNCARCKGLNIDKCLKLLKPFIDFLNSLSGVYDCMTVERKNNIERTPSPMYVTFVILLKLTGKFRKFLTSDINLKTKFSKFYGRISVV